jgi:hypothetical protein
VGYQSGISMLLGHAFGPSPFTNHNGLTWYTAFLTTWPDSSSLQSHLMGVGLQQHSPFHISTKQDLFSGNFSAFSILPYLDFTTDLRRTALFLVLIVRRSLSSSSIHRSQQLFCPQETSLLRVDAIHHKYSAFRRSIYGHPTTGSPCRIAL